MDTAARELLVARVASGTVRLAVGGRRYVLRPPTPDQAYAACEVYREVFGQSEEDGLYSDDDLLDFLLGRGLWDGDRQKLLDSLPKEIEEFKLKLFAAAFRSNERKVVRKALAVAKEKLASLASERNAYNHLSCAGSASIARTRYLVGCGLFTPDGQRVFGDDDFWEGDCVFLDDALSAYAAARLPEGSFRLAARTEPWRPVWNAHKAEGKLFGVPAACYTDEQKALVSWSSNYDAVYSHPDCPPDDAVEDDDVLDGWMIDQRRKREARLGAAAGEARLGGEKIRNSQEVYVVAETREDARKVVEGMNDEYGRAVQRQRFNALKKKGTMSELEMPDTEQRLRMAFAQRQAAAARGTR